MSSGNLDINLPQITMTEYRYKNSPIGEFFVIQSSIFHPLKWILCSANFKVEMRAC